jgi:2-methylisocitrate lyase-like PEP mutase family enzyme
VRTQEERATAFRALHAGEPFVIPNPWDAGSARVLEALGFHALATTSSGFAFTLGRLDGGAALEDVVAHVSSLAAATSLPVSVDLENGYGAEPKRAAAAVNAVADAGAVGGSIEDWDPGGRLYDRDHAVDRVAAAAEGAHRLPFPFTLTARAENHIRGNPDLDDTIARLIAYRAAGADAVYAPGLTELEQIAAVVEAVDMPVNVLALPNGPTITELASVGVRRVSTGSLLARSAYGALMSGAHELLADGTSHYAEHGVSPEALRAAFG